MRKYYLLFIIFLPLISNADSMCKKNERVVFSCELEEGNKKLSACYDDMDNTMYFLVGNAEKTVIYKPYNGMGLEGFKWVHISSAPTQPLYVPLRFKVDENRNAYFNANKAGIALGIMDSKLMFEDNDSIFYDCIPETRARLADDIRSKIETVEPNKFEAWD
ncbi:hypothetical protein LZS85_02415 [Aliivibrio fischeri]|uniref:hypothetical protein n=1 Tax=Aliivibrio fischeri TaxID=668 RepID=UPI0009C0B187|nr:hypothetical protein [Aliivibrio fischeri]MCE7564948.1 hypothetical protein [Aliivibrio fischeri]